jgi:hypothetical protein
LSFPTFYGQQKVFKVFDTKFWAFLCWNKKKEGIPFLYVIVARVKVESKLIQCFLFKDAKLHGAKFSRDNFTVAQWMQTALADGLASVYSESHSVTAVVDL